MPGSRKRFSIDDHLGRTEKALKSLFVLDEFEEVRTYTVKHSLFDLALEQYCYHESRLQEIMRLYAVHLETENKYKDAAIGAYGSLMITRSDMYSL